MKEQLMVFINAYGATIAENDTKEHFEHEYKHIDQYIKNGWVVVFLAGTGVNDTSFRRGSFACLLEREIKVKTEK